MRSASACSAASGSASLSAASCCALASSAASRSCSACSASGSDAVGFCFGGESFSFCCQQVVVLPQLATFRRQAAACVLLLVQRVVQLLLFRGRLLCLKLGGGRACWLVRRAAAMRCFCLFGGESFSFCFSAASCCALASSAAVAPVRLVRRAAAMRCASACSATIRFSFCFFSSKLLCFSELSSEPFLFGLFGSTALCFCLFGSESFSFCFFSSKLLCATRRQPFLFSLFGESGCTLCFCSAASRSASAFLQQVACARRARRRAAHSACSARRLQRVVLLPVRRQSFGCFSAASCCALAAQRRVVAVQLVRRAATMRCASACSAANRCTRFSAASCCADDSAASRSCSACSARAAATHCALRRRVVQPLLFRSKLLCFGELSGQSFLFGFPQQVAVLWRARRRAVPVRLVRRSGSDAVSFCLFCGEPFGFCFPSKLLCFGELSGESLCSACSASSCNALCFCLLGSESFSFYFSAASCCALASSAAGAPVRLVRRRRRCGAPACSAASRSASAFLQQVVVL